jgi:hypothetical protein
MATQYRCPQCGEWTPLETYWQTAWAYLRRHRKAEHNIG